MTKLCVIGATLFLLPLVTEAQTVRQIDIQALLSERAWPAIQAHPRFAAVCGNQCHGVTYKDVQLIPLEVRVSDVRPGALPDRVETDRYIVRNCSALERSERLEFTLTETSEIEVIEATVLKNTLGAELNMSIGSDQAKFGGKVTGTIDVSFTDTTQTRSSSVEQKVVSTTNDVSPYSDLILTTDRAFGNAYYDFSGTVLINAVVLANVAGGGGGYHMRVGQLSDIIPNLTFEVKGYIWNGTSTDTVKNYQEIIYTRETCPSESPNQGIRLNR